MQFGPEETCALVNPGISKRWQGNRAALVWPLSSRPTAKCFTRCNLILMAAGRVFQKNWIGIFWGSPSPFIQYVPLCKYTSAWLWADDKLCVLAMSVYLCASLLKCEYTTVVLKTYLPPDFVLLHYLCPSATFQALPTQRFPCYHNHFCQQSLEKCDIKKQTEHANSENNSGEFCFHFLIQWYTLEI